MRLVECWQARSSVKLEESCLEEVIFGLWNAGRQEVATSLWKACGGKLYLDCGMSGCEK